MSAVASAEFLGRDSWTAAALDVSASQHSPERASPSQAERSRSLFSDSALRPIKRKGDTMPTSNTPAIVLVHGGFTDGTCWQEVIRLLIEDGYTTTAVQNPLTSLADDISTAGRALDQQPGPVILVGHSYGGAVITGAAVGRAHVKALVYVAAFAPDASEQLGALASKFGPAALQSALLPYGTGFFVVDRTKFQAALAADVPQGAVSVLAGVQTPMAAGIVTQAVDQAAWKQIPSWYLITLDDQAIPPDLQRFMAQRIGAATTAIHSSHMPFLSHPAEVVSIIKRAAMNSLGQEQRARS